MAVEDICIRGQLRQRTGDSALFARDDEVIE
jgi:hypothetical protein